MRITLTSVFVDDQAKALKFYTNVLGFRAKTDIPLGKDRWLTVVSPEGSEDVELLLEPMGFPPARTYQKALFDAGIPLTAFGVDDVRAEHRRLEALGVAFKTPPTPMGPVTVAVFDDTCGNLIQIVQKEALEGSDLEFSPATRSNYQICSTVGGERADRIRDQGPQTVENQDRSPVRRGGGRRSCGRPRPRRRTSRRSSSASSCPAAAGCGG
jgi:catechol 2,3-dioxygenase-like lactoylglutathione lyase family enzyme